MHQNRTHRTRRTGAAALAAALGLSALAAILPATPASAYSAPVAPYLVSRTDAGAVIGGTSYGDPAIDGTGRYVAFSTQAKLVAADTNDLIDVYVRDRWAATTELISRSTDGDLADGTSHQPSISDDGRYVLFRSAATNWGGPATGSRWNLWVRDRATGTTTRASIGHAGDAIGADAEFGVISGSGRYVAYSSAASNIVSGDTNGTKDVFVRDLVNKTNERVSISVFEGQSLMDSYGPSISDDGNRIAFVSGEELAGGRADAATDVFVRDRSAGTTYNANLDNAANSGNADPQRPVISGNGRYVAFASAATNLVTGDSNGKIDVFRRDLKDNVTVRVSLHDNDAQLGADSGNPSLSDTGDKVAFTANAPAVSGTDAGPDSDVFVRSVIATTTVRASTSTNAPDPVGTHEDGRLSDDGLTVAFRSFVPTGSTLQADQPVSTQHIYASAAQRFGPLASPSAFIDQQYQDFLGRTATSLERATWNAKFESGQGHPAQLIAELAASDAFAGKRAPVVRLYWAFFLRTPDAGGLNYWIAKYQGGASLASIAQKFAQSSEFTNRYGTLSNSAYVTKVYLNVFERTPDASGVAFWKGKLDRNEISRGQVLVNFSESNEGKRRLAPQVHLLLIPLGMLRTLPSKTFFDAGKAVFDHGERQGAWVAQMVLAGPEYDARL